MTVSFYKPPGELIALDRLRSPKARSLANALLQGIIDYADLVECRTQVDTDIVVFDVEVEVPQLPTHPINPYERVAVIFDLRDENIPEVLALRSDFPRVPHLNIRDTEFPRSLCLFEEQYRDLKRRWTAPLFAERIRQWFALTAKGSLHQDDQPLEPLLSGYVGHIVLPHNLLDPKATDLPKQLYLTATNSPDFLIAQHEKPSPETTAAIVASVHCCPPQHHGIIRRRPSSLAEIAAVFEESGLNLLVELRERLKTWLETKTLHEIARNSYLVLIFVCPKTREKGAEPESVDIFTFITNVSVVKLGEKIGLWQQSEGHLGLLVPIDTTKIGEDIKVDLLNSSFELTRDLAARLNGQKESITKSIVAIGVGALGSQVVMNLARSGFGKWTLIDNDRLMPHNVARHALTTQHIGWEKSITLALEASGLIQDDDNFAALCADVIKPGQQAEALTKILRESHIILDMSASVTAARFLSLDINIPVRRVSLFLTPTGEDLVLLAEDNARSVRLDELEMQYYRAIVGDEALRGHFKPSEGRRRYGQSCRDVTSQLPQDLVALHAAIGAYELRQVAISEEASITVWRADRLRNVRRIDVTPAPVIRHQNGEWKVCVDNDLLRKLHLLRDDKLPNETGGVLLGSLDLERNIIYIVETIPSPPDSKEWPTLYIRGYHGLAKKVDQIYQDTNGMIEYIGEWHSHPTGIRTVPSADDIQVFSWLTNLMNRDGLPPLMMIVGDPGEISCFVAQVKPLENLLPVLLAV